MNPRNPLDWTDAGRVLATRLLASGMTAFALSDLAFRYGALSRQHAAALAALAAPPGQEHLVAGVWATHLDGRYQYLTRARIAAENAFNAGWDSVVEGALRDRTRAQRLPGEVEADPDAGPSGFLTTLGLPREYTAADVKRAYHERAMAAHPDVGGDHDLFVTLGRARDAALDLLEARAGRKK